MLKTSTIDSALIVADVQGRIVGVNERCSALFGYSSDELLGEELSKIMPTPYKEQHQHYISRFLTTGVAKMIGRARIVEGRHKTGEVFSLVLAVKLVRSDNRVLFHGFMKRLEDSMALITIDSLGVILACNAMCRKVFGYELQDLVGQNVSMLMAEPHRSRHDEYLRRYLETGERHVLGRFRHLIARHQNGTVFPISMIVEERSDMGVPAFRAKIEKIHHKVEAVVTISQTGDIISCNDGFLPLFGYLKSELIGQNVRILMPEPYGSHHDEYLRRHRETGEMHILGKGRRLVHGRHKDGSTFPIYLDVNQCQVKGTTFYSGIITRVKNEEQPSQELQTAITYVGPYVVCDTLGKGSSSVVKLGRHQNTGYRAALKVILKDTLFDRHRIDTEVRVLRDLHHPFVAELIDVIETDEYFCLVLECVSDGDLCAKIERRKGPLTEEEARVIFRQLVSALAFMHARHIVHRDLKLENILIDSMQRVKLIDFGLAQFFNDTELLRTMCGTPNYAAPELLLAQQYRGPPVDVWSLGVVLYCLVCANFPFHHPQETVDGRFAMPKHVTPALQDLLSRMLCVDPRQRATVDAVARHSWTNIGYASLPFDAAGAIGSLAGSKRTTSDSRSVLSEPPSRPTDARSAPTMRVRLSTDRLQKQLSHASQLNVVAAARGAMAATDAQPAEAAAAAGRCPVVHATDAFATGMSSTAAAAAAAIAAHAAAYAYDAASDEPLEYGCAAGFGSRAAASPAAATSPTAFGNAASRENSSNSALARAAAAVAGLASGEHGSATTLHSAGAAAARVSSLGTNVSGATVHAEHGAPLNGTQPLSMRRESVAHSVGAPRSGSSGFSSGAAPTPPPAAAAAAAAAVTAAAAAAPAASSDAAQQQQQNVSPTRARPQRG